MKSDGVIDRLFTEENDYMSERDESYEAHLVKPISQDLSIRSELMNIKLEKIKEESGWQKVTKVQELPLLSQIYYRTMINIILLLIFLSVAEALIVYTLAASNYNEVWKTDYFSWNKLWYFLITPYEFVITSEYPNISETIIRPCMMVFVVVKFIMDMSRYERLMKKDLMKNDQGGMFRTLRQKNLEGENEKEIKDIFENVTGPHSVESVCSIYAINDYKKRERKIEELRMQIRLARESGNNTSKLISKKRTLEDENKITRCNLLNGADEYLSNYALVTFYSYVTAYETFKRGKITIAKDPKKVINSRQKMSGRGDELNISDRKYRTNSKRGNITVSLVEEQEKVKTDIKLWLSPHPYDIDWNSYDREDLGKWNLFHIILWVIIILILPVATYFVEFKFSMRLALQLKLMVNPNSDVFISNTFLFMSIRVLLSALFNFICTTLIDYYYIKKRFKTFSSRNSSKFYFYNVYFMLSQISADFYGVLSAGLISLSDVNDVTKLKRIYSTFLFTLALKTGFVLLIQPLIIKFNAEFIRKLWWKFILFCHPKGYRVYHRLEADAPLKHDISLMASFQCQALFYVSFFSTYLMPMINFLMIFGILVYWIIEKKTFQKYSLVKDSLDINNINMIYCLGLYGFIFSQALSVGNIKIIIAYFDNPSFHELEHLLQAFFDYGIISQIIAVTIFFNWYYSTDKIKKRILQYLAKQERRGNLNIKEKNEKNFTESIYVKLNPFYKLQHNLVENKIQQQMKQADKGYATGNADAKKQDDIFNVSSIQKVGDAGANFFGGDVSNNETLYNIKEDVLEENVIPIVKEQEEEN